MRAQIGGNSANIIFCLIHLHNLKMNGLMSNQFSAFKVDDLRALALSASYKPTMSLMEGQTGRNAL